MAIAERVLWAALVAWAAGAAYLMYLIWSGEGLVAGFGRLTPTRQLEVFSHLRTVCRVVSWAAWAALAGLAVRSWGSSELGYLALLAGALCQLAVPRLLVFAVTQQGGAPSAATSFIVATFRDIGTVALGAGALLGGRDLWERISARRLRARVVASRATSPPRVRNLPLDAKQDRFLGKCWELPLCRPAIRQSCPVFIRGKQPCWRIGVGCMCSEEVLIMAARTRGEDLTQPNQPSQPTGTWKPQLFTLEQLASRLTPQQKRERCMNCAIYLHHQAQKYRALLPVTVTAVIAALALALPWFHRAFVALAQTTDRITGAIAPHTPPAAPLHPALKEWSGRLAEAYVAEWILFLCVGLMLLSLALHALEYAITRRGW